MIFVPHRTWWFTNQRTREMVHLYECFVGPTGAGGSCAEDQTPPHTVTVHDLCACVRACVHVCVCLTGPGGSQTRELEMQFMSVHFLCDPQEPVVHMQDMQTPPQQ